MFKVIEIQMTEPLCSCDIEDLRYTFGINSNVFNLIIFCDTCKTTLEVPSEKMLGQFKLDKPYKKLYKDPILNKEINLNNFDNVIPFKKKTD